MDKHIFFEKILGRIHFPKENVIPLEFSGNVYKFIIFHNSGQTFHAYLSSLRHLNDVDDIIAYLDDVWANQSLCKNKTSYLTMQSNYMTNLTLMNNNVVNFINSLKKSLGANAYMVNIGQSTTFNLSVTLLSNGKTCCLPSHFDNMELPNTLGCVQNMIKANGQPLDIYVKAVEKTYSVVEMFW